MVEPSENWYCESVMYQVVLQRIRSPTWMEVALELTFDRLHPVALVSDASVVADRLLDPSGLKIDNDVVVYGFDDGVLEMVMIQFVPSPVVTLTPIATGVPPGPVSRPDTITYSTAASTTVMATIRMVAITGDTAASSFRMMLFMVLSSCGLRRHSFQGGLALLNVSWLIFGIENMPLRDRRRKSEGKRKGKKVGALAAYDRACEYKMPWESAINTWYPGGYEAVLIRSRSPTMTVEPPLPMNWALFVFQFTDVRDENAMLLTKVLAPPPVVIVSFVADVVRPVGVVVINSVQFVPSPDGEILTPITRGP